jgi:transcriptional regulator with XRE-family HTH domain
MNIGEKIKYFRAVKGMSGEDLSERSGISISTIRKYEVGIRKPKPDQLLKICEALGVSINTFLDFDIKTVSDLLSLIFKMDEQLDIHFEAEKGNDGAYLPQTLKLSFENELVNQKLLSYMTALEKRDEYIASVPDCKDKQVLETLSAIEQNISDLRNQLINDNTVIQKKADPDMPIVVEPSLQTYETSSATGTASSASPEIPRFLQDVLFDCTSDELELIAQTAQTIKKCLRKQSKNKH